MLPVVAYNSTSFGAGKYTAGDVADIGGTSRHWKWALADCSRIRVVYGNYTQANGDGIDAGLGPLTIKAVLEYPLDTFTPVTFDRSPTLVLDPGAPLATSDALDVVLPKGTMFWIRTYATVPPGTCFPLGPASQIAPPGYSTGYFQPPNGGDNYPQHSGGAGTDQLLTPGTAWFSGLLNSAYGPLEVIGDLAGGNEVPVCGVVGDSIAYGYNDIDGNGKSTQEYGYITRALQAGLVSYRFMPQPNETARTFGTATGFMFRMQQLEACTHVIYQYGVNDIFSDHASVAVMKAQALANWQKIAARGPRVYACTILPQTASSDSWTTAGNQTTYADEATKIAYNTWLRAPASAGAGNSALYDAAGNLAGVFDPAKLIEVNAANGITLNGGRWYCGPNNDAAHTNDGTHPVGLGHSLIASAIETATFTVG